MIFACTESIEAEEVYQQKKININAIWNLDDKSG
jgi:hypothetical protein